MTTNAVRKEALAKISLADGMTVVGGGGATTSTVPHLMGRAVQRDHFLPFQASRENHGPASRHNCEAIY